MMELVFLRTQMSLDFWVSVLCDLLIAWRSSRSSKEDSLGSCTSLVTAAVCWVFWWIERWPFFAARIVYAGYCFLNF